MFPVEYNKESRKCNSFFLRYAPLINVLFLRTRYAKSINDFYGEKDMKRKMIFLTAVILLLQLCSSLWALTTTAYEAEMAVKGWLKIDPQPLGAALGRDVIRVKTFADEYGEPVYHIVYLEPSGFVIVSADDLVEPIIGFAEEGTYNPSPDSPFGTLVTKDLNSRMAAVRNTVGLLAVNPQPTVTNTQMKWNFFMSLADVSEGDFNLMALEPDAISDVRVAPLVSAIWGQRDACGYDCYNYYTPNNYPCGCVATTLGQLMRFHQYPAEPNDYDPNEADGKRKFSITWFDSDSLSLVIEPLLLRGGDGNGGPYKWDKMPNVPSCNTTLIQRQAVGAICYDAGIACDMLYTEWGSGAYLDDARRALVDVFKYSSAVEGCYDTNDIKNIPVEDLEKMINPNLDAGNPVFFGIFDEQDQSTGHSILCDGYGYNASTIYHHLSMGWDWLPYEAKHMWYLLPDISNEYSWQEGWWIYTIEYDYDIITSCVYNIFTTEKGEIISGRLFDTEGNLVEDASVTAQIKGGNSDTAVTNVSNSKGIYALKGLDSDTTYTITVEKTGYDFEPVEVTTGKSENGSTACGNTWGLDFEGYSEAVTIGAGKISWVFPMYTGYNDARTQVIYLASEIGRTGNITDLSLEVTTVPPQILENWTIRMKHTRLSEYSSNNCSLEAEGWTVVYQNNESIEDKGWRNFEFQTPFEYNGTDNLMVDFSFNNSSSSSHGLCRVSSPGGKRSAYAASYDLQGDPLDWQNKVNSHNNVPDVKLTFSKK